VMSGDHQGRHAAIDAVHEFDVFGRGLGGEQVERFLEAHAQFEGQPLERSSLPDFDLGSKSRMS